jgi:LPS O-antigen subunit length determinant protein (WzzB/FepE family)
MEETLDLEAKTEYQQKRYRNEVGTSTRAANVKIPYFGYPKGPNRPTKTTTSRRILDLDFS